MKKTKLRQFLIACYHFVSFFLLIAALATACMLLFWDTLSTSLGLSLSPEEIRKAALVTFGNIVFLSFVCTVIDTVRRKVTVERPVKQIVVAAEKIAKGDYSVRIPRLNTLNRADGLDEIIECYNKMAEELSGIETLQTDFIANVSHELKTPLSVMQNYGTLLQQPNLSEEDRVKYAKAVSDAARRLAYLITNILKLNKLENQQIYPASEQYDLNEQLCECFLRFEHIWEEKNIEIETDLEEEIKINADPELLSLVWNNLFSNAFKFTESGGKVSLSLKAENGVAIVEVSDTGCGITPEVGKRIFDKFYQGDTSHATEGNGLGLALVHRVVSIVGGDISVESGVGKGSIFTVKLKVE